MEWLEHAEDGKMTRVVYKSRRFGPLFGSALGLGPQCGFSVISAELYSERKISVGAIIAVFIATSDEDAFSLYSEEVLENMKMGNIDKMIQKRADKCKVEQ